MTRQTTAERKVKVRTRAITHAQKPLRRTELLRRPRWTSVELAAVCKRDAATELNIEKLVRYIKQIGTSRLPASSSALNMKLTGFSLVCCFVPLFSSVAPPVSGQYVYNVHI